ncbi:unnamed protein product [Oncorhynchus mykiss]|uniref:Uncharacterized protein n=1 Tax=Oncorhynchus mykiss TaxID=8022 RepID=A0A060WRS5_ONCMY|nr:unnamed protein product [Oncorhynchus mykiss]
MYRRLLQSAVRNIINTSASRVTFGKALEQEACLGRALIACRLLASTSPSQTQCRTLHSTSQVCANHHDSHQGWNNSKCAFADGIFSLA